MSKLSDALKIVELGDFSTDYKPKSSSLALKEFLESSIYKDFLGELAARIEDLRDFLEVSDSKKYFAAQGAAAFARLVSNIFLDLLENKLSDIREEEFKHEEKEEDL